LKIKALFEGEELNEDNKSLVNWFIINVLPVVHVASWAKDNWHPYAYKFGVPPLYSNYVTFSDKAFALFLIKHYKVSLPAKEIKGERKQRVDMQKKK